MPRARNCFGASSGGRAASMATGVCELVGERSNRRLIATRLALGCDRLEREHLDRLISEPCGARTTPQSADVWFGL